LTGTIAVSRLTKTIIPHQDPDGEGRKYDIEIPFFKEDSNIVDIHARTIRPDGSIVNFEGKAFEKSILKAKGMKYPAKTVTCPRPRWAASSSTTTPWT
jgi:hypothetical protein